MAPLKSGILNVARAPYDELLSRWQRVEALGFDSAWLDDDLNLLDYNEFEPGTLLGALGRETTKIRIGTLVSVPLFRPPSLLASQIVTADHLSGGRINVEDHRAHRGRAHAAVSKECARRLIGDASTSESPDHAASITTMTWSGCARG